MKEGASDLYGVKGRLKLRTRKETAPLIRLAIGDLGKRLLQTLSVYTATRAQRFDTACLHDAADLAQQNILR
jgi:hypothetical protein